MDEGKITLDAKAFKALASDTRLTLMKLIDRRPMTVSELSRETELNKTTLLEHLEKLVDADIAERLGEEERKWVYYQLTWRGKRILHPEKITIALMLSTGLASMSTAILSFWLYFAGAATTGTGATESLPPPESAPRGPETAGDSSGAALAAEKAASDSGALPASGVTAADPALLYVAIALLVLFALAVVVGYYKLRKEGARPLA